MAAHERCREEGGPPVKAVSLWNPWAGAITLGWKVFETRSWYTKHRGALAIHAAKTKKHMHLLPEKLRGAGDEAALGPALGLFLWPFGAIVCLVDLVDCLPAAVVAPSLGRRELAWGDYSGRRWAWKFANIRILARPVACVGRQKMWNLLPETADAAMAAAGPAAA